MYHKIGYYSYVDDQLDWLNTDSWIGEEDLFNKNSVYVVCTLLSMLFF